MSCRELKVGGNLALGEGQTGGNRQEMEEEKESLAGFIDKVLRSDKDDELGPYVTSVLQQWRDQETSSPAPDPVQSPVVPREEQNSAESSSEKLS